MEPIIIQPHEGKELSAFGDVIVFKLQGGQTGNDITIGMAITPPGGGPPLHVHHREHEIFIIESGDLEMNVHGEWKKAPPGSVVFLPKDVPHQFRNAGATPSRHWVIATPSGFEDFYDRAAAVFAAPGPPDIEKVLAAAADYGMEVIGPPPGAHD
ncbi:MAG: cupin domain-containing protein [Armatimonadetes bacterium]|nr:cupin domain-containing protein [Armatimonadota bacterium]